MIVIDSCVWIEALQGSPTGQRYLSLWDKPDNILVSTCVQYEIKRWCERFLDEEVAAQAVSVTRQCVIVPITEKIALLAAEFGREYRLAALDAMIYATTIAHGATLVSCDAHFAKLEHVDYKPKS